jgi:uncharacterized protein YjbJ (UPF0337 family)
MMKGSTKVLKGQVKEAVGKATGDDKLRAEGQTDQIVGHGKQAVEKSVQKVKASGRKLVRKATTVAQKAIDKANRW